MSLEVPTIEKKEIKNEEISELENPLKNILKDMLPNLEKGEYDLIIGVDASGRIPLLILEKFVKYVYKKKGHDVPMVRFLAGDIQDIDSNEKINATEEKIKEWNPKKKVLIVDDTIYTGQSIKFLCDILNDENIKFDLAVMGDIGRERAEDYIGADNVYKADEDVPSIYKKSSLSGVIKDAGDTFSNPLKKTVEEEYKRADSKGIQRDINKAREDVSVIVNDLVNWYEVQNNE